jgi:flagellin
MAINDISLSAGMRNNLNSLQATAQLLDRTQYRLSTGKKVNNAIDNPTAFFAAQSLNSRASIIDGLKDQMGQAIQTVTAADKGIKAITSLIEQAKGIAQQALAATGTEVTTLANQYDSILTQIDSLAADSGYKGKNLLTGATGTGLLTVKFEGTHTLDVTGFVATSGGLALVTAGTGATAAWTSATTTNIDASITKLDAASETLRQSSAKFSANLSIITTRQEFSTDLVNTLSEGANKLTLADTNEEGANMLMLQTRQSLGTTALSLSAQAAQSVLRLFG